MLSCLFWGAESSSNNIWQVSNLRLPRALTAWALHTHSSARAAGTGDKGHSQRGRIALGWPCTALPSYSSPAAAPAEFLLPSRVSAGAKWNWVGLNWKHTFLSALVITVRASGNCAFAELQVEPERSHTILSWGEWHASNGAMRSMEPDEGLCGFSLIKKDDLKPWFGHAHPRGAWQCWMDCWGRNCFVKCLWGKEKSWSDKMRN